MQFEFATAARIIFGPGKLDTIGEITSSLGKRALVACGAPPEISKRLQGLLDQHGVSSNILMVEGEPTIASIEQAVELARERSLDVLIGIGGGSAIDTAKATAALVTNPGDLTDYLEVIGANKPLSQPALPIIAIPTTAGTGSEVTRNAVIGALDQHVKVSLRSPYLLPSIALVDPELTLGLPPEITASTGLDALTQLIEPFTCSTPNPLTDALCLEGIQRAAKSLRQVYSHGDDLQARVDMSLASLFSGLALANARLGAVHGLAGPIGGEIPAHHGEICASLLPHVLEANIQALLARSPDHPVLERYATIGKLLSGTADASPASAIEWVKDTCQKLNIKPLSAYGLQVNQFPSIIEKAQKASSMRGNPITLSDAELRNILQRSLS